MVKRTRDDFLGDERRNPQNRWSRVLESRVGEIEEELVEIRGQLVEGKSAMGSLKMGQSILMHDLGKTKDDVKLIQENTGSLAATYRDFIGARRVVTWILAIIISISAAVQTAVTVVERYNQPKMVAPK